MKITVAFIITIDSSETIAGVIANWLQQKNIQPDLFYMQRLPSLTRLVIICELDGFSVGLTARRLRKLPGITAIECLCSKQYNFRPSPAGVSQILHQNK